MSEIYNGAEASRLVEVGRELSKIHKAESINQFTVVPVGFSVHKVPFDPVDPLPDHIRQRVTLNELASFAAYVKRYQTGETVIFGTFDSGGAEFEAVFDYHAAASDGAESQVRHAAHRATYPCPFSKEWLTWTAQNAKSSNQEAFAKFLDDNAPDITSPDGATLLEIVQGFEAHITADFSARISPKSGAKTLTFSEEIDASGGAKGAGRMDIPDEIALSLPVFVGGKSYDLTARIRFRVDHGKLGLWYELRRPHKVIEAAVKDLTADIAAETAITPLAGSI